LICLGNVGLEDNKLEILALGRSQWRPVEDIVPLYAPGQNSRNEKYIRTSIADWNLYLPEDYANRLLQKGIHVSR
jgi:hypothetical protein